MDIHGLGRACLHGLAVDEYPEQVLVALVAAVLGALGASAAQGLA